MPRPSRLVEPASGTVLADSLDVPRTFIGRGIGLMFRSPLAPGQGMLIDPCNGIHMLFMRFPIDALFLDRQDRVKKVYQHVRPWVGVVWLVIGARKVVELPAGTLGPLGLKPGEQMELS